VISTSNEIHARAVLLVAPNMFVNPVRLSQNLMRDGFVIISINGL
jgi:hypothetical protein